MDSVGPRIQSGLSLDWIGIYQAFQLSIPNVGHFLCRQDGSVYRVADGDPQLTDMVADPSNYTPIGPIPPRIQYQWLESFVADLEDDEEIGEVFHTRLRFAINGKGAFRRFKDLLLTAPELRRAWFEHRDGMLQEFVVEWVAEQGLDTATAPPWADADWVRPDFSNSTAPHMGFSNMDSASALPSRDSVPAPASINTRRRPQNTLTALMHPEKSLETDLEVVGSLRMFFLRWFAQHTASIEVAEMEMLIADLVEKFEIRA